MNGSSTTPLYEALARWQWWRRRLSGARGGARLELRKRLLPPTGDGPADGAAGLDTWLLHKVSPPAGARIVDLGCGFGASLQRWVASTGGSGVGIAASPFQVAKATASAAPLGDRCRFLVGDFTAIRTHACDVALAIESLQHADDLPAVLRAVAAELRPTGTLVWVDDWRTNCTAADPDVRELAMRWCSPPLREGHELPDLLLAAGLRSHAIVDLTTQVPRRSIAAARPITSRWWQRLERWAPTRAGSQVANAFLGGLALERLYARGCAGYRVCLAKPIQPDGGTSCD
jgi:SAM-dependent methyltransferase